MFSTLASLSEKYHSIVEGSWHLIDNSIMLNSADYIVKNSINYLF